MDLHGAGEGLQAEEGDPASAADLTTLERRHHFCLDELRLNARLARETYLSVVPVSRNNAGFMLGGEGEAVDWLFEMVRLPEGAMMSSRIAGESLSRADVLRVADRLCGFYRSLPGETDAGETYVARLSRELALDRATLDAPDIGVPGAHPVIEARALACHRLLVPARSL